MINYFENDYSIPVLLGNGTDTLSAAELIRRQGKTEIHIFADRLSVFKRAKYSFHKLPRTNRFIIVSLLDFASSIHEYFTPILIYSDEFSLLIDENRHSLESKYIIIPADEIKNILGITLRNE